MEEGVVVRAVGGFFFVHTAQGQYRCYLRGRIKRQVGILVGDRVQFLPTEDDRGVIEKVLPRHNSLRRPPVANIDQGVVVTSLVTPPLNINLLDRFLVLVAAAGLRPLICFNKTDLVDEDLVAEFTGLYRNVGYQILTTSTKAGSGLGDLREALTGKVSVLAGPSGVGKSSLLNQVQPGLSLKTGEVSQKLRRGRHTTRHVELLPLSAGGWVADTPGFTALDLTGISRRELMYYFPEMVDLAADCRFPACLHWHEPDCGVKTGVEKEQIHPKRYQHYLEFLQELEG